MAKKTIAEVDVEQLQFIFGEIAQIAEAMHRLSIQAVGEEESEMIEQTFVIMHHLAEKIGWAADLGTNKIGGIMEVKGGAEAWMMPPAYHLATEQSGATS